jgi:amino acid transporter
VPDARPDGRAPGWREVLLIAAVLLGAVLGLELLSAAVPAVRELFRDLPLVIVGLVAGTAGLLLLIAVRRPPRW